MVVAVLTIALFTQTQVSDLVEKRLRNWTPSKTWPALPEKELATNMNLEGLWRRRAGLSGSSFVFKRVGKGLYRVEFETGGCLDAWKLKRTATFVNGMIALDRPVSEYMPTTYNRLYAIRRDNGVCLVTAEGYADMRSSRGMDSFYLFSRAKR